MVIHPTGALDEEIKAMLMLIMLLLIMMKDIMMQNEIKLMERSTLLIWLEEKAVTAILQ
ncbi:hypothetical protein A2U01_0069068, partial [Trifolium medium]|nr:hypothetical protein [Trifolium medium]